MLILSVVDQINVTLIIIGETNYNNINLQISNFQNLTKLRDWITGLSQRCIEYETETKTKYECIFPKGLKRLPTSIFSSVHFNSIHNSILNSIRFDSIHMKNERD